MSGKAQPPTGITLGELLLVRPPEGLVFHSQQLLDCWDGVMTKLHRYYRESDNTYWCIVIGFHEDHGAVFEPGEKEAEPKWFQQELRAVTEVKFVDVSTY